MNITGIITEYNPFHNGHKFHLEEAKKQTNCDGVICIMSGNFVQRGGPAIVDKWQRTEMALNNGVDLIIELPTFYAVSSAEFFAKGAVSILNSLGVVDNIFFGSECGDSKKLLEIAKVLVSEDSDFQNLLKRNLSLGLTFAKSREKSLIEYLNDEDINKKSKEYYNKTKDIWRDNFHFEPPFGLINDPNGLSYYKGEYYIFFQWNPYFKTRKFH